MPSGLQRVRLEASHLGEDRDSAPSSIPQGKGYLVQNYLTGEKGRIKQRGAISTAAIAHGAITRAIAGFAKGNDKLYAGYVDLTQTARTVERHVAPRKGAAGADLAQAFKAVEGGDENNIRLLDLVANNVSSQTSGPDEATRRAITPGYRGTRVGRFVYIFGIDTANDIVTPTASFTIGQNDSGGYERLTYMLRWDLSAPTVAPVIYLCGPYGGQDLRFYQNKLFALGGRQPETGGGFIESNVVWYTREWVWRHHAYGFSPVYDGQNVTPAATLGNGAWTGTPPVPLVGAASDCNQGASSPSAMWFDPEDQNSPLRIDLPGDEQDHGVAFAFVGRNLGILKRRSAVLLVGGDPDTWQLRTAFQGVGCLDPRSVVEANEGVFFLSQQGFIYWDGVQLHNTSTGVQRTLLDAAHNACGDEATAGGFAVAERLDRDYIFLTIGRYFWHATAPPDPDVYFCGLYHIPSNSWTTFKSGLFSDTDSAPVYFARTENRIGVIGHLNAYQGQNIPQPDRVAEASRGQDTGPVNIETKWHSRTVELSMPFEKATIERVIIDYNWVKDAAASPDTEPFDGPTVTLCDATGTPLGGDSTFTLPYGVDDGREVQRQRITRDVYVEAQEVQVRIEYSGTATALVQCDIQDVWIEYQTGQERRGVV